MGPGAGVEAAAASDPEVCREVWTAARTNAEPFGKQLQALRKGWRTKREGKAHIMSDLQERCSSGTGSSNQGLCMLPHCLLAMGLYVAAEPRASGK